MFHNLCVYIVVATCILTLVSCRTQADLQRHVFVLDEQIFAIPLPTNYVVLEQYAEPATIRFGIPDTRSPRSLQFQIAAGVRAPLPPLVHTRRLNHGHVLRYHIHQLPESGSGGTESILTGIITVGETTILVTCHEQAELNPESTWCLPYLQRWQPQ
ncbi:MAG: hypothetical protein AAGF95_28490 [Chloroflexota bacterium]